MGVESFQISISRVSNVGGGNNPVTALGPWLIA